MFRKKLTKLRNAENYDEIKMKYKIILGLIYLYSNYFKNS